MREWRKTHRLAGVAREKANVRAYSRVLVERGTLERKHVCERCDGPNPQRHHPDYSNPFLIEWLCPTCHREEHKKAS